MKQIDQARIPCYKAMDDAMNIKYPGRLAMIALLFIFACGAPTEILTSWKAPTFEGRSFSQIVVIGLSNDIEARKRAEEEVVDYLRREGIRAEPGIKVFPPGFFAQKPEEGSIRGVLKERGADGALVISVLDIREKQRYVPSQTTYRPTQYYSHFYGYWSTVYEQVNTPGYTSTSTDIFLESNLYDVESTDLLWSAQSVTGNPQSLKELARSYAKTIVAQMIDEDILVK